jgi:O-antigen ligase
VTEPILSDRLEAAVAAQAAAFVVGASWAFGGNAEWVRTPLALWGTLGIVLTGMIAVSGRPVRPMVVRILGWAWPVLALDLLVALSCLTPGFQTLPFRGQPLLVPSRVAWWTPSATRVDLALLDLWIFNGIYFSSLNLALAASRLRTLHLVFAAVAANVAALAVLGTAQKLAGSPGLYFGAVPSPQPNFFASFVYDNHWAAFSLLCLAALAGLILHSVGRPGAGFFRGPAFGGAVAALLIAVTIPLSGSRAGTLLLLALAALVVGRGTRRVGHALRRSAGGTPQALALSGGLALLVAAGAWWVAGDTLEARAAKTREQVGAAWSGGGLGSRGILYHDTWRMAEERPLFGWGMASFPVVFSLYNSQESKIDRLPVLYHDAHSDWLQSLAELGVVGTGLLAAAILVPARTLRGRRLPTLPFFLLAGCLLIGAYAWVEFPFGNLAVVLAWWLCFFCAVRYVALCARPAGGPP